MSYWNLKVYDSDDGSERETLPKRPPRRTKMTDTREPCPRRDCGFITSAGDCIVCSFSLRPPMAQEDDAPD